MLIRRFERLLSDGSIAITIDIARNRRCAGTHNLTAKRQIANYTCFYANKPVPETPQKSDQG